MSTIVCGVLLLVAAIAGFVLGVLVTAILCHPGDVSDDS